MRRRNLGDIVPLYVPPNPQPGVTAPALFDPGILAMYPPGYPGGLPDPNDEPNFAALQQAGLIPNYAGGLTDTQKQSLAIQALMRSNGQANPFRPTSILPDSVLPPALKRTPPATHVPYTPNGYDLAIQREARIWKWVAEHGGLRTCCRIPELGAPIYNDPPWEVMPSNGSRFERMYSLTTLSISPFTGNDIVMGSFQVPVGWDGVVDKVIFGFNGTGFVDFSGDITWRLQIGQRYAKGLGNVINTYGSLQNAFLVPGTAYRTISGQTVAIVVNVKTTAAASGTITGGIFGYNYPRR